MVYESSSLLGRAGKDQSVTPSSLLMDFALLSGHYRCFKTWSNFIANPSFHSLIFMKACFSSLVA